MGTPGRVRVPVGADAARWVTRGRVKRVLFVVHNVTSATRLLDVKPLFDGDLRVQMAVTCTGSSPFLAGVPELLAGVGLPVLPWEQAKEEARGFDVVISASYGGELEAFEGKLVVLSHGVGYNKRLAAPGAGSREPGAGSREPGAGSREPGAGSREPGAGSREPRAVALAAPAAVAPVFGLGPEWLLHQGRPLAAATVLSHPEQLRRLRAACPEAAPTAVLAGDPCYDRILEALPHRDRFRRAFGVAPGQRLVVLNSTWAPRALFGDGAEDRLSWLLTRLTSELPADEYRTVAVLHPNIWYGHGPGQVRAWLERARRAGLTPVDPLEDWRQALIAADCVIGDHGSVTYYAAAIGRPVLLGSFPEADLDPESPVAALGRAAPRLRASDDLRHRIPEVIESHDPRAYAALAELTSSAPGRSAALLRNVLYRMMDLPEPAGRPALLGRLPLPAHQPAVRTAPVRVLTRVLRLDPPEVAVARYTDPAYEPEDAEADAAHTVVHEDTSDASLLENADVILRGGDPDDPRLGPPGAWADEVASRYPRCGLAAYLTGVDRGIVRTRGGEVLRLAAVPGGDGRVDLCDPAAYASGLYAWLGDGHGVPGELTVVTGAVRHRVVVERVVASR
ncbi:hypothetical protein J7W19_13245 [Streptomyces mobaraensis NBRC 13819 = DSM 40847]|nr:hypothetical protein J7W19_13245 [Streptomyces mobaraensis NBRC 13819 = DSM 40847]